MVPSFVDRLETLAALASEAEVCLSSQERARSRSFDEAERASRARDMGTGRARRRAAMLATDGLTALKRDAEVCSDRENEPKGRKGRVGRGMVAEE